MYYIAAGSQTQKVRDSSSFDFGSQIQQLQQQSARQHELQTKLLSGPSRLGEADFIMYDDPLVRAAAADKSDAWWVRGSKAAMTSM